jgi:hypothetical protein
LRSTCILTLRTVLGSGLLSLTAFGPLAPIKAAEQPLDPAVVTASNRLQAVWADESASRDLPFPLVKLISTAADSPSPCPWSGAIAAYCQPIQTIQINKSEFAQAAEASEPEWLAGYWISLALVQALVAAQRISPADTEPAANLQANCLSGVLMARSQLQAPANLSQLLTPALYAYGLAQAPLKGTATQRAYAFLSGFGATDSLCDPQAMQALAENRVPDPERLEQISLLTRRGNSSLLAVLSSRCRPRPGGPCPRRLTAQLPSPQR